MSRTFSNMSLEELKEELESQIKKRTDIARRSEQHLIEKHKGVPPTNCHRCVALANGLDLTNRLIEGYKSEIGNRRR